MDLEVCLFSCHTKKLLLNNTKNSLKRFRLFFVAQKHMSFYEDNRKEQNEFYWSGKWKKCRATYLSEHPVCERCIKIGIAVPAEHVHHKIELDENNCKDPMIALNPDNLEALCFECHRKEHHNSPEVGEDFYFDDDGNLVRQPDEK